MIIGFWPIVHLRHVQHWIKETALIFSSDMAKFFNPEIYRQMLKAVVKWFATVDEAGIQALSTGLK